MNWPSPVELHYRNSASSMPYNSIGSLMDFFGGLSYDHASFIFSDIHPYTQESMYSSMSTNSYKVGFSETGSFYYDYGHGYVVNDHTSEVDGYNRNSENSSTNFAEEGVREFVLLPQMDSSSSGQTDAVECPRNHQSTHDYEVVWQDNIDPDNMTYEELLELGEAVGTQSRGLSQELISLLPVSKFKCSLFSWKRARRERCVICQMEYKRGDRQMTLPCKHVYHVGCGSRWLSINKACPICYKEISF